MAMKKTVLLWTYLFTSVLGYAQDTNGVDSLNDINAIKSDTSYIYAEATMKDAIEAQSGAKAILELKIYDWLRNKHPELNSDSLVLNTKDKWFDLVTSRGKYKRAFVYVDKREFFPVIKGPEPDENDLKTIIDDFMKRKLSEDEETMADIRNFNSIEPYVKGLINDGKIKAYGKYASLPENSCYLFVYDRCGSVVAVLRQTEDGSHFNIREKRDDNVKNYKNCGAIWFQLK